MILDSKHKRVLEWSFPTWIPEGSRDKGDRVGLPLPQPLADPASFAHYLLNTLWRRTQKANRLDQIGLSGAIRSDQEVEGAKRNFRGVGTEGEQVHRLQRTQQYG